MVIRRRDPRRPSTLLAFSPTERVRGFLRGQILTRFTSAFTSRLPPTHPVFPVECHPFDLSLPGTKESGRDENGHTYKCISRRGSRNEAPRSAARPRSTEYPLSIGVSATEVTGMDERNRGEEGSAALAKTAIENIS